MQRKVERALVAKVGAFVFAAALALPVTLSPRSAQATVMVASVLEDALAPIEVASLVLDLTEHLPLAAGPIAVAATVADDPVERAPAPAVPAPAPAEPPRQPPTPAPIVMAPEPPPEALVVDGVATASWYGPGFYGNRTACGQTYTPEIEGVAHRILPCGTRLKIASPAGVTVVVPVIDRGPYIAGRSLDLSNATKLALRCSDLCRVHMTVVP